MIVVAGFPGSTRVRPAASKRRTVRALATPQLSSLTELNAGISAASDMSLTFSKDDVVASAVSATEALDKAGLDVSSVSPAVLLAGIGVIGTLN
jgi:hypothetical protein